MKGLYRSDLPSIREAIRFMGFVVAEVDADLRYVWIDNPHPDFDAAAVIGKRDDEIIPLLEAEALMALKRDVLQNAEHIKRIACFSRSDGRRAYTISGYPILNTSNVVDGVFTVGIDAPSPLVGFIPICSYCHSIRDEEGNWHELVDYLRDKAVTEFTHSICPVCAPKYFGECLPKTND